MKNNIETLFQNRKQEKSNLISIVLPLYNEEESLAQVIKELFEYLSTQLFQYKFEITFIDDCSTDNSYSIVKEESKTTPSNIKLSIIQLSKNSGSHVAITAGLNIARGEYIIIMASDGQDPPTIISQLITEWKNGNDLVFASRIDNLDKSALSKIFSKTAWKIMKWSTKINIPETGCDLLGMDKMVLQGFNSMDERNTTFIFKLFSLGYQRKEITYIKRARIGGKTKWNFIKKMAIMLDAISGFSNRPLQLITKIGLFVFVTLIIRWIYVIASIYIFNNTPSELDIVLNTIFTSLSIVILILGMIGDYIWRILDETRKRPPYEIRKVDGEIFNKNDL